MGTKGKGEDTLKQTEEHQIKTCSLQELMDMDIPYREHLVIPWLRQGESSMIYAAPGVGKSLFALDIALSVAGGGKVLGIWASTASTSPVMTPDEKGGTTSYTPTPSAALPPTPSAALPATPSATLPATPSAALPATPSATLPATPSAALPATPSPTVAGSPTAQPEGTKGWKVLYVDGEMPLDDIRDRAGMLMRGKMKQGDGFDGKRAGRNLHFMARHQQGDILADFVDLADDDSRRTLLERIQREKIDLVILDNLSTLAAFEDENAASAFNGPVDFLQRLKSIGTACILVHHTNKGGENFRGSTRIAATFETLVLLKATDAPEFVVEEAEATEEEEEEDGEGEGGGGSASTGFTLSWHKYRGMRDSSIQDGAVCVLVTNTKRKEAHWKVLDGDQALLLNMVEMVRSGQYATQKELAEALATSTATLSRMKQRAIQQGRITKQEWDKCLKEAAEQRNRQEEATQEKEF